MTEDSAGLSGGVNDPGPASTADRISLMLLLGAGACYLAVTIAKQPILVALIGGLGAADGETILSKHALRVQLLSLALLLPAVLLLGLDTGRPRSLVRASLKVHRRLFVFGFVVALAVSFVLNALGAWPFTWRWPGSTATPYARVLLEHSQFSAICIWAVTSVLIIPVLEEAVFRVGVLRGLAAWTGSPRLAIIASSLLFGTLHLGTFWRPDTAHLVNSFWIFAASLVVGHTTVRDAGNASVALGSHVARNAIEFTLLFVAIGGAPR